MSKFKIKFTVCLLWTLAIAGFFSQQNFWLVEGKQNQRREKISKNKDPKIISRRAWKANAPNGSGKKQKIRFITIHHTAYKQKTDLSIEKKLQNLQAFSQREDVLDNGKKKPAWLDVPYHFYIAFDGKIAEGRQLKYVGDTNTSYDPTGHALIVLEGNFEVEEPTAEQQKSLEALTIWLAAKYNVPASEIKGHNDYAQTGCPGKNLKSLFPPLREKVFQTIKRQKQ